MSANLRGFIQSVYGFDAVVRRVPASAWSNPSPCEGWTAADVVSHQIGVLDGVARAARGEEIGMPAAPVPLDDPLAAWTACRNGVLEALDHDGALQRSGKYWFGEMSVDAFIAIVQWDPLAHAWDLSRAAGLEPVADDELAAASLATMEPMAERIRKWRLVGDPVEVPATASPTARFLGFVGRDPS